MELLQGLAVLTVIHVLALASPGPDLVLVTQQTLVNGKRAGLMATLGITLGIGVHMIYSALGLAALIAHSAEALWILKILGGAYLLYLGFKGMSARPAAERTDATAPAGGSDRRAVTAGFLCNILNPKAPLFFVTLFTVVFSPQMPLYQLAIYGTWMLMVELAWFSALTLLLSRGPVRGFFLRFGHWVDRVLGALLAALGLKLLLSRVA